MSNAGRPKMLDEAKQREICALLSVGSTRQQAAKYVGCAGQTLRREAKRDAEFAERMRRAEATASLIPLQAMRNAMQTHWRAAAWALERRYPDQFGRKHRNHIGAAELRALRRDLIDIFQDEIDHPLLRERIASRVKAAIDYAMRHAWDQQRSGGELHAALQFFEKRTQNHGPAEPHPNPLAGLVERINWPSAEHFEDREDEESDASKIGHDEPGRVPTEHEEMGQQNIDRTEEKLCTKFGEFSNGQQPKNTGFPASDSNSDGQNV